MSMEKTAPLDIDFDEYVPPDPIPQSRKRLGRLILAFGSLVLVAAFLVQALYRAGTIDFGFANWRPVVYAYLFWGITLGTAQVLRRGEAGVRALFVLPAVLFVVAMVVFPLLFGLYISFTDWNLSSLQGRRFNGLDNFRQMLGDAFYWNALKNMVWYTLAVLVEYAIAFGMALLLHSQIRARKFFRVVFLLPLMLSPVAVSWMVGKSMMEIRFGPIANFARWLGWENPAFFTDPWLARFSIMAMDAWTFIPLMMIMLLAGLQALPKEVMEAARVDGANPWQTFWKVVFPLTLPVSITAVLIRIIFKLKLADVIINVTAGGPGGATDSVTSFIFRVYRDRSNVGYGTLLAMVYLVLIVVSLTIMLNVLGRWMRGYGQEES
ncbi:carbohydrate ABC transporter permease [Chelativorans xinjiangense]|uniref:carbohydrate ABC transporter permease n=1 Tax=Chelativorans xinjiangense TaxID=2681485 RepID=UPI003CCE5011